MTEDNAGLVTVLRTRRERTLAEANAERDRAADVIVALEAKVEACERARAEERKRFIDAILRVQEPRVGSCWNAGPILADGRLDRVPPRCELPAGHAGAHCSGDSEWMNWMIVEEQGA